MRRNQLLLEIFLVSFALSVCWHFFYSSNYVNFIQVVQWAYCAVLLLGFAVNLLRKRCAWRFSKNRSVKERALSQLTALNIVLFPAILFALILEATPTIQMSERVFRLHCILNASLVLLSLATLLYTPFRKLLVSIHLPLLLASGFMLSEWVHAKHTPSIKDTMVIGSPLKDPFIVLNAGHCRLHNTHVNRTPPVYLFAATIGSERFSPNDDTSPESRFQKTFGAMIYAPADGTVYEATDEHLDNSLTDPNITHPLGNFLTLQIAPDRYIIFSNLKHQSLKVAAGDTVKAGQAIGQIGHSGVLSECLLALCITDGPELFSPETQSFPFYINHLTIVDGDSQPQAHYPKRNDIYLPSPIEFTE